MTQKIESAFSRVVNGNFSHGVAYWESVLAGSLAINPGGSEGTAPSNELRPRYLLQARGHFQHILQYKDLPVYPAKARFSAFVVPIAPNLYLVVGQPNPGVEAIRFQPFGVYSGSYNPIPMKRGSKVLIGSPVEDRDLETRINRVLTGSEMIYSQPPYLMEALVNISGPGMPRILDGATNSYTRPTATDIFDVRISNDDLQNAIRPDGTTGVRVGDYFVARYPLCAGKITSVLNGSIRVHKDNALHELPPVTVQTGPHPAVLPIRDWYIVPKYTTSLFREGEFVQYDLTLVFDVVGDNNLSNVYIKFYDEIYSGNTGVIAPVRVNPGEPVPKFWYEDQVTPDVKRYFMRFLSELEAPIVHDKAVIEFSQTSDVVETNIGDVALFRGNYVDRLKKEDTSPTSEVVDLLESPINVESNIIPKGAIIAYVGGSVCPPGYVRAEGIGQVDSNSLNDPDGLRYDYGEGPAWYRTSSVHWYRGGDLVDGDFRDPEHLRPMTILGINDFDRASIGKPYPYQVSSRYFPVAPFRYLTGSNDNLLAYRDSIGGDPSPALVTEEYRRTDVVPGDIVEFLCEAKGYSVCALIVQVAVGEFVTHVQEGTPPNIFQGDPDLYRANRQVSSGMPRNSVYQGYGMFGAFHITREQQTFLELYGDFQEVISNSARDHAHLRIWKSGTIAHAQRLPEINIQKPLGGYGYFGEPHTHVMRQSQDIGTYGDVGHSTEGPFITTPVKVPYTHTHRSLFGAVTIPRIRPVLLCQKI